MSDRPIIFSAPMVRALLDGRKTMTRRLAWRDAKFGLQDYASEQLEDMEGKGWNPVGEGDDGLSRVYKPTSWQRVQPGELIWVRENLTRSGGYIQYAADGSTLRNTTRDNNLWPPTWKQDPRPSIHMPRWASRLTLRVTAVKIERLQDISEDDAQAEGVDRDAEPCDHHRRTCEEIGCLGPTFKSSFCTLWCKLHGDQAWRANPEVVAVSFDVIHANIDSLPKQEAA